MLPEKIRNKTKDVIMYGSTVITIARESNALGIVDRKADIDQIEHNIDSVFGPNSFKEFKESGKEIPSKEFDSTGLFILVLQW